MPASAYFLRQRFSQNLELPGSATLAGPPTLGVLSFLQQTCGGLLSSVFHIGAGDLESGPYAHRANTLATKPPPEQFHICL